MENVVQLPPHTKMTVEDALEYAKRENLTDVLIIGFFEDGDLLCVSSAMTREQALWLCESGKLNAMGLLD